MPPLKFLVSLSLSLSFEFLRGLLAWLYMLLLSPQSIS